jgi:hypothetical protein
MKLLFAHSSVKELLEATNEDTIGIEYDESTSTSLLMETLKSYPTADRLGFAFHFGQTFMNQEELFSDSDLLPNAQYSRNVQFIIDLIRNYEVVHVDFLACSTLLDERWKQFYAILHLETGVVVGASDDNTGNLKYGGDWIMESTQEDVSQIYFNDTIVNFAKVLFNSIFNGTSVAVRASYNTNVTSVVIGTTVTSIGNEAFMYCSSLKSITFNATSTLKIIGTSAFYSSGLTSVSIPKSVTEIGYDAFRNTNFLLNLTFETPSNLKTIGNYAFFVARSLNSVEIPNSVISLGYGAFSDCSSLKSITFNTPIQFKGLPNYVFIGTGFTEFKIPNSFTSVGNEAFSNCRALSRIVIPSTVNFIGSSAFNYTGNIFTLIRYELTNNIYFKYIGSIASFSQRSDNIFSTYFFTPITDTTKWRELKHILSIEKTRVFVGESCGVTIIIDPDLLFSVGHVGQMTYSITGLDNTAISGTLSGNLVSGINMVTLTVLNETAFNVPLTINLSDGTTQTFTLSLKTMPKNQKVQTCFSRF